MENKIVKLGVIGLGNRGYGLLNTIMACEEARIVAVCDKYQDRVDAGIERVAGKGFDKPVGYLDYMELINDPNVDAVFIVSSWDMHVDMAIASMKAHKYTAVEVSGAYDVEDCWQLVRTYEETKTPIMLLENCCFDKFELLATSLERNGKLGRVMYCHGAYAHELRDEILGGNIDRHYRLNNYMRRNCENYPTHEFGPIAKLLKLNRGNKALTLSSVATTPVAIEEATYSEKNRDKSLVGQKFNQGDIVFTTITTTNGEVITLRLDTSLPRFYSREFTCQGTKGLCIQDTNMVMLENKVNMHEFFDTKKTTEKYLNNAEEFKEYLPDEWKYITKEALDLGHGGMDFVEFKTFFDCILNNKPMPIDVYDMALWLAITPLSEQSIKQGGAVQAIPDFTRGKWLNRENLDVVKIPVVEDNEEDKENFGHSRA